MRKVKKSVGFAGRNDRITTSLGADFLVILVADAAFEGARLTTGFFVVFLVVAMRDVLLN